MYAANASICRWILSATPIQNGINDWNNLCKWLRVSGEQNDTIMLRRTMADLRADIKALPPPPIFREHELTVPDAATSAEGKLFYQLCNQLEDAFAKGGKAGVSGLIKLELFMRIQQFLVHPQLYIERMRAKFGRGAYPRPDWTDTATKWTAATTDIRSAIDANRPVIVFCQFHTEMDMVRDFATRAGAAVWSIRGGMTIEETRAAVSESRAAAAADKDQKPVVLVVQIVSGGVGLNLQFCKEIVFLSQHWNPAVVHQAIGRAVRIGQRDQVIVHTYNIVDGVLENLDRKMVSAHNRKIATAKEVCATFYQGYLPMNVEFEETADLEIESKTDTDSTSKSTHSISSASTIADDAVETTEDDPTPVA
jgi:SNF2 family DNA or RNA helicase